MNLKVNKYFLNFFAIIYLYIPIYIFVILWIKFYYSIPIMILTTIAIILFLKSNIKKDSYVNINKKFIFYSLLMILIVILWCMLSGIGGFTLQNGDYVKGNSIYRDLIEKDYPVRFENGSLLCYYIGYYIFPAFIGKIFSNNFDLTNNVSLIYASLGIIIAVYFIYFNLKIDKPYFLVLIILLIISFEYFLPLIKGIYLRYRPDDTLHNDYTTFSNFLEIRFPSNVLFMSNAPGQFIPILLALSFYLFNDEYNFSNVLVILSPIILFSTFNFVGIATMIFIFYILLTIKSKKFLISIFDIKNILTLPLVLILLLYLSGIVFQDKPIESKAGITITNFVEGYIPFLLTFFAWGLWALILLKFEYKNLFFIASCISIFLLSFISMGKYNDFYMRAVIVPFLYFNYLVIKNIFYKFKIDRSWVYLILVCIMVNFTIVLPELYVLSKTFSLKERKYRIPYESSWQFYTKVDEPYVYYQYLCNEPDKILNKILK